MTAKLVDEKRRKDFKVFIFPISTAISSPMRLPNFRAAVGTAGSANIGKRYAMFEAIHGSAPRMMKEGRGIYADPCSMLRATVLLLSHIGATEEAAKLERALDFCMFEVRSTLSPGRDTGTTCEQYAQYVIDNL